MENSDFQHNNKDNFKTDAKNYIIAVDIGTSETKSVLISENGYVDHSSIDYPLIFPRKDWAEQKVDVISSAIHNSIKTLLNKQESNERFSRNKIKGIVFTSQMQSILPVALENNKPQPLRTIITWLDSRAAELTKEDMFRGPIKIEGIPIKILYKYLKVTGGVPGPDGKNTVAKARWIKKYQPEIYEETHKFMDIKDFAVLIATDKWVTSVDMAYVSWLMDTRPKYMDWSDELCELNGLDKNKFLEIKNSTEIIGNITGDFAKKSGLPEDIKVINGAGDLLAAAIGSGAIKKGELHANIGTAGWVGTHYHKKTKDIPHYAGTIASGIPGEYLILCKQETLGGALEWAINNLYQMNNTDLNKTGIANRTDQNAHKKHKAGLYKEVDAICESAEPGSGNLIFTPWLFGERSPVNDPNLRGQWFNLSLSTTRADLFRSVLEGVAYNLRWGIEIVTNLSKIRPKSIRLIGGGSKSDVWCQIFADVWNMEIKQMEHPQMASALGAAGIAFVGLGIFKSFDETTKLSQIKKKFSPRIEYFEGYSRLYGVYKKILKRNRKLFGKING